MTRELYLGADVGGTDVKYAVAAAGGDIVASGRVPTDIEDPRNALARVVGAAAAEPAAAGGEFRAAGLACAGIVSPRTGLLGRAPNLPRWEGIDLRATMSAAARAPSIVANDVNGALYGEWRQGAGRGFDDLVMLALGTGVGGGVMVRGELVTGASDGAGEIGHMIVDPAGPECCCGNRGCLEAFCGAKALIRAARKKVADGEAGPDLGRVVRERGDALSPDDLRALAEAGDEDAGEIWRLAGDMLGIAVGNLINVLDPPLVIIGGGVSAAGDLILAPCRARARSIVMSPASRSAGIVRAALGSRAAAVGAALMARDLESAP